MKKIVISDHQLFALTATASLGGSIVIASAPIATIAKQDAWLGSLVTAACGLVLVAIYYFLGSRYPGMTLIGILRQILGKWVGTILAIFYITFFINCTFDIPWYIMDFWNHVMHETPRYAFSLPYVFAFAAAVLYGIEVISRASEIFIKIVTVIFFTSMIMVFPNVKSDNILPVFENGLAPVLKSSVLLSSFITTPMVTILMVFPSNTVNIKGAKKSLIRGILWSNLLALTVIIMSMLVLGSAVVAKSKYPTFSLLKEINIRDIFTRLEYFSSIIWIMTEFIIGTLFFYSSVTGISELLKLKDYRKIVVPFALIVFIMSGVVFPSDVSNMNWVTSGWMPYSMTVGFIIPVILLIVHAAKKVIKRVFE